VADVDLGSVRRDGRRRRFGGVYINKAEHKVAYWGTHTQNVHTNQQHNRKSKVEIH
jgi:hypothetical protein